MLRVIWAFISRPVVATVLHGARYRSGMSRLFEAALQQGFLHYAKHASFLGTGLLFWWCCCIALAASTLAAMP
ncbi:cytochrome c oxidase assembly protein [Mesorhizobium sp. M7A.F.Ca.US.008.03.1.1]|uniref:cytochrome c oxidase assembly protein n=1 Tax=Mesorhizobium sp. M7A.F.Ca.US.008.03.1.1 TaxID=2496742 RepID=UPI001FE148BD|nr:cytochrome c oxidase assembly protein [Mesorhizobium sp. M7A.F.Ca.US.008.03.1.1]